jgi:hypothetical protein
MLEGIGHVRFYLAPKVGAQGEIQYWANYACQVVMCAAQAAVWLTSTRHSAMCGCRTRQTPCLTAHTCVHLPVPVQIEDEEMQEGAEGGGDA